MTTLLGVYMTLYALLTFTKFRLGISLLFLLLPVYLIRFSLGPLPTTLLEIMLWTVLAIWGLRMIQAKESPLSYITSLWKYHRMLFCSSILFLGAATLAIFFAVDIRTALGEWKAFYVEPLLLACVLFISLKQQKKSTLYISPDNMLIPLLVSGSITALLAIYQHYTGWMVPHAFWANGNSYRVTAWYGFPNGVGLFLAPLVPIAWYYTKQSYDKLKKKKWKLEMKHWGLFFLSLLSVGTLPLGVFFAKSTGGLIAIAGAIGLLLFVHKKTRWGTFIIGIAGIVTLFALPQLDPIQTEVTFQDRSGQIRLAIYGETIALIKDHPIVGAGLASYDERIAPYHETVNGEKIEIFHHPHNIFLTMWVNIGIIGLIAFIGILISNFKLAITQWQSNQTPKYFSFLFASFITILIMGIVDSPYIKNDLAILFWGIVVLLATSKNRIRESLYKNISA